MSDQFYLADLADQDILDIAVYLARFGVNVANRAIDRLNEAFQTLSEFPGMGRGRDEVRKGLRSFPVDQFVVYYGSVPDGIRIVRILHGSRDITNELS